MQTPPVYKDVVLVGGGHSHSLLIRRWAMHPLPGVRLTLVSESPFTPYSGMLPGLLAGHYTHDQAHIDLSRLCQWAGVRFIAKRMTAINLNTQRISMDGRPDLEFDLLSLDTGSTPDLSVQGAREFATPVKPVSQLFDRWQQLSHQIKNNEASDIGVVGSGAGGFEIVMALRHALPSTVNLHWVLRGQTCLNGRPAKVGEYAMQAAIESGVKIHAGFDVSSVSSDKLIGSDGKEIALDEVLWCTGAAAPSWILEAGLQTCDRGFVATNAHLQSMSHAFVFATGDVGTQIYTPSDKAGVFAVRQAPVLYDNIRRYFLDKPLKTYKPQKTFLSLMATGGKSAIANRGAFTARGDIYWRLKDSIDQKFMRKFSDLPTMSARHGLLRVPSVISDEAPNDQMRCKGCGSKVAENILHNVLSQLTTTQRDDVESGLAQLDDAAVFAADNSRWVQSVDQISAITDDPYIFGKIAAVHALSDVVTQTLDVHSAQAVVALPHGGASTVRRDLYQMLKGALSILDAENCALVGGHTAEASDTLLGFVVNGKLSDESQVSTQEPLQEGDAVILCKALGTGLMMAAHGQLKADGDGVQRAIEQMQQSNRPAAHVLRRASARRVTDVTGFGLLAHVHSMFGEDALRPLLLVDQLPVLEGALELAASGVQSSLYPSNSQSLLLFEGADDLSDAFKRLVCDPQTSGGLLAIVPDGSVESALSELSQQGYADAAVIAQVVSAPSAAIETGTSS